MLTVHSIKHTHVALIFLAVRSTFSIIYLCMRSQTPQLQLFQKTITPPLRSGPSSLFWLVFKRDVDAKKLWHAWPPGWDRESISFCLNSQKSGVFNFQLWARSFTQSHVTLPGTLAWPLPSRSRAFKTKLLKHTSWTPNSKKLWVMEQM